MIVYLIELVVDGLTYYWYSEGWTVNAWDAIWYVRQKDAQRTLDSLEGQIAENAKVEEHMFSQEDD